MGYYFSHDKDIHAFGDKGGFNPNKITEINIYDVYEDGKITKREDSAIEKNWINFSKATPENVYKLGKT